MRCFASVAAAVALLSSGCGGGDSESGPAAGAGGAGGSAGSGATGGSATGGAGGSSSVPLLNAALDGKCPGGKPPGTGVPPGNDLHKVTLDEYPDAVCNDGSPGILYVRAASLPAAKNSWVIHLQAGGSCSSWEECRNRWCAFQSPYDAAKMSSTYAPDVTSASGIFARNAQNSLGPANQVYVYYCSSDAHRGRKGDVVLDDPAGAGPSFRLHFRGFQIVEAVNDALAKGVSSDDGVEKLPSLSQATQIVFSGSSAGSQGQTGVLDYWAGHYPSAKVIGLFDSITDPLPEDIADPAQSSAWDAMVKSNHATVQVGLYDAFLDESCRAMHTGSDAHLCASSAHVRLNHVTTPFFVRQDLTDPVQYDYFQKTGASLDQFATALRTTMLRFGDVVQKAEESIPTAPGVYASDCGQHIILLNNAWFGVAAQQNATLKDGAGTALTAHAALHDWFTGAPKPALDTHPSTLSSCLAATAEQ